MLTRRDAVAVLAGAAFAGACARNGEPRDTGFLLSYFAGAKDMTPGLRLAASADGLSFRPLKGGDILLVPEVGEKKLMRDPFLLKGPAPDDPWHLLWTTAWEGVTIGHATSHDLVHWSPQQAIPVMASVPGTRNVWAPEMIWDAAGRRFVLYWSSTVAGRFAETAGTSESGYNHRLWYATTRDFRTVSKPELLWDPGFSVIDATFLDHPTLGLHLIVKDETVTPVRKHLRIARAASPTGPFADLSPAFTPQWVEGPAAIVVDDWTYVFYDRYRDGVWGAARSRELTVWEDASSLVAIPPGARHGTIVRASASLIATLA